MGTAGPDFVSFQVRDREASARFYEEVVGLERIPVPNEHAAAFSDGVTTFAVRDPFPGTDLDSAGQLGAGVGVWFHSDDAGSVHRRVAEHGADIVQGPFEGPFGLQFAFRDLDGYVVTIHARG